MARICGLIVIFWLMLNSEKAGLFTSGMFDLHQGLEVHPKVDVLQ